MTFVPDSILGEAISRQMETPSGTRHLVNVTRNYFEDARAAGNDIPNRMLPTLVSILNACLLHLPQEPKRTQENSEDQVPS